MKYLKHILILVVLNLIFSEDVYSGYVLYTPQRTPDFNGPTESYLQDVDGSIYNSWEHTFGPASMPYLYSPDPINSPGFENTLLYYPCKSEFPTMINGGVGGRVEIYNWEKEILWSYELSNELYQHHHDIEVLPNGNFLIIAWERKYESEWQSA